MPFESNFDEQKTTEAAGILLSQKGGRIDHLWLIKILYYIDREALLRWERSITNDSYVSMDYGPVLSTVLNLIKGRKNGVFWKKNILTLVKGHEVSLNGNPPHIKKLSKAEVELIREIYDKYGHYTGFQLAKMSHDLPEWIDPQGSSIPIHLQDLLKGLSYSTKDIERITTELQVEAALDAVFEL